MQRAPHQKKVYEANTEAGNCTHQLVRRPHTKLQLQPPSLSASRAADFERLDILSRSAFDVVWRVRKLSTGQLLAGKVISLRERSQHDIQAALNEALTLSGLQHCNLTRFFDAFLDCANGEYELCVIMELGTGVDLRSRIEQSRRLGFRLPENTLWAIAFQLFSALAFLHENNVAHRDVKTTNIFCTPEGQFKLGVLQCATPHFGRDLALTRIGSPSYMAPEIWAGRPYGKHCDVWALGCVIYECAAWEPPFRAGTIHAISERTRLGHYPPLPREYTVEFRNFVHHLLTLDPLRRPTAAEVLSSAPRLRQRAALTAAAVNTSITGVSSAFFDNFFCDFDAGYIRSLSNNSAAGAIQPLENSYVTAINSRPDVLLPAAHLQRPHLVKRN